MDPSLIGIRRNIGAFQKLFLVQQPDSNVILSKVAEESTIAARNYQGKHKTNEVQLEWGLSSFESRESSTYITHKQCISEIADLNIGEILNGKLYLEKDNSDFRTSLIMRALCPDMKAILFSGEGNMLSLKDSITNTVAPGNMEDTDGLS